MPQMRITARQVLQGLGFWGSKWKSKEVRHGLRLACKVAESTKSGMAKINPHTATEKEQIARFINCLNQAMVAGKHSQRGLCDCMGITIGSLTKYLRGNVAPLRVGLGIQAALAHELGVTVDALYAYYTRGEYVTEVTVEQVASWIRSDAGQSDLPQLMESLKDAGQRWVSGTDPKSLPPAREPEPYTWPIEELRDCGVSEIFRERLGLTDEALRTLATSGEFDEELAEAFGIACNYEKDAVIEAFSKRVPIA